MKTFKHLQKDEKDSVNLKRERKEKKLATENKEIKIYYADYTDSRTLCAHFHPTHNF